MAGFSEYLIGDNEFADVYRYSDCHYRLDGGALLRTEQTDAWCYSCSRIIAAESLPSLDELDRRIRDLDNPDNLILKVFGRAELARERTELPTRLAWRAARQSGPRCLECGSTSVYPLLGDDCTEPRFQKRFRRTSGGFASMAFEVIRHLSPEGLVIFTNDPARAIKS